MKLAAYLKLKQGEILELVDQAERLAQTLRAYYGTFPCCAIMIVDLSHSVSRRRLQWPKQFEWGSSGEGDWTVVLSGDEGTLIVDGDDAVRRQRADEDEPVRIEIPNRDQPPAGFDLMQHSWNQLVADFVQAIRRGDVNHTTVPHLPTVEDGLRCQEIIAAARKSDEELRWVSLAEL